MNVFLQKKNSLALVAIVCFLAFSSRFLPHLPNMTLIGALAMFVGAVLQPKWLAQLLMLGILVSTDFFMGYGLNDFYIYLSWMVVIALSQVSLTNFTWKKWTLVAPLSSLVFFLLTNAGFCFFENYYPHSFHGLMKSYFAGVPFLRNQMLGDLVYSSLFFSLWQYASSVRAQPQRAR